MEDVFEKKSENEYKKEGYEDDENDDIIISNQFKIANKIKGDKVLVDGVEKNVVLNEDLKGVFGIIGKKTNEYPFKRVKIENV